mgnify:CR=1 FL=1
MKAKKIVYLRLIMVVLISGCNHQNNNMKKNKSKMNKFRKLTNNIKNMHFERRTK